MLVLDRPNPIRCDIVEGPLLDLNYQSFVGKYPIPIRYGWTVGELAKKIVAPPPMPKILGSPKVLLVDS